jgi:hypothetical protein
VKQEDEITLAEHNRRIARLGGAAGTGDSKRRSPEHYRRMQLLGVEAKKRLRAEALKQLDRQAGL